MDYLIIFHHEPIGKLVEPRADFVQGIVGGRFIPLPAYKNIQSVFRAYAQFVSTELNSEQCDEERIIHSSQERDAITSELSITTLEGSPVEIAGIDIDDFSEQLGEEGYEAHFVVSNREFFNNILLWDRERWKKTDLSV